MQKRGLIALGVVTVHILLAIGLVRSASADGEITVYRAPSCGCCLAWVDHLRANGFTVSVEEVSDLVPITKKFGVPGGLEACHTATINGYVVEGHVPASDIRRLLESRPDAKGIAVPGMPIGSPGMERGDEKEPYDVILFGDAPETVFATH